MTSYRQILRNVLSAPHEYDWTAHGIGMMRTYINPDKTVRLNLWHRCLINPGISTMHTHARQFVSHVVCGRLDNHLMDRVEVGGEPYTEAKIRCGAGYNGLERVEGTVMLSERTAERYGPGQFYEMRPDLIHYTRAVDGTATMMSWDPRGDPTHEASIFWPADEEWGDASRRLTLADSMSVLVAVLAELDKL